MIDPALTKLKVSLEKEMASRFVSMTEDFTNAIYSVSPPMDMNLNGMGPRNVVTLGVSPDFPVHLVPDVG